MAGAGGITGTEAKEGVGRRCHPVPEGLGAHLSFPGPPLQTLPLQGMRLPQALLKGQPDPFCRRGKARAEGTGAITNGDAISGLGRRSEESTGLQPHWGGWGEPKAREGSARVFHDPSSTPARGRTAEKQQVLRARGTETTGVTQM